VQQNLNKAASHWLWIEIVIKNWFWQYLCWNRTIYRCTEINIKLFV